MDAFQSVQLHQQPAWNLSAPHQSHPSCPDPVISNQSPSQTETRRFWTRGNLHSSTSEGAFDESFHLSMESSFFHSINYPRASWTVVN